MTYGPRLSENADGGSRTSPAFGTKDRFGPFPALLLEGPRAEIPFTPHESRWLRGDDSARGQRDGLSRAIGPFLEALSALHANRRVCQFQF